jgi:uncharacterized protein YeaO (DUF488 family)
MLAGQMLARQMLSRDMLYDWDGGIRSRWSCSWRWVVGSIGLWRAYDDEPPDAGKVFLVDRLWPRGVRRDALPLDDWVKDVAPSPELRKWYAHDVTKWAEFRRRYRAELDAHPHAWQPLLDAARSGDVTLVYSTRDREHNSAVVLRDYLIEHLSQG